MKQKLSPFLVAVLISISLISCDDIESDKLSQNTPVNQSYRLEYNNQTNETNAIAEFRVANSSGVHVQLKGDTFVRFNGEKQDNYTFFKEYTWKHNGFVAVNFEYHKNSDQFLNTISPNDISLSSIPNEINKINRNSGIIIYWQGEALENDELITVKINQNEYTSYFYAEGKGVNNIIINADNLQTLSDGDAELYFERKKTFPLDQSDENAGGKKEILIIDNKNIELHSANTNSDSNNSDQAASFNQIYCLEYNKFTNETTASAAFNLLSNSNEFIPLSNSESIKFNNTAPDSYSKELKKYIWKATGFISVNFQLEKKSNQKLINSINSNSISMSSIPTNVEQIELASGIKLYWEGSPLENYENINIRILQENTKASFSIAGKDREFISLSSESISLFSKGEATLYFERRKTFPLDQEDGNAGGEKILIIKDKKTITFN